MAVLLGVPFWLYRVIKRRFEPAGTRSESGAQ